MEIMIHDDELDCLADKAIDLSLDGLAAYPFGHPNAGEADADYWQAISDLAHHPRFNDIVTELPFQVRVDCEGALL